MSNVHFPVAGALCYIGFAYVADYLQTENLPRELILGGAFLLTLVVLVTAWLIYSGFRRGSHVANRAV
jgi:hypothetical protein